jgi:hypothetical protein
LSFTKVEMAVEIMLNDRSISVREETVKLLSGYIVNRENDAAQHYLLTLLPLLEDEGISVRKAVVNILKDTLLKYPFHLHYLELCSALLRRLTIPKEEDSIKEHICSIFQSIWFLPPSLEVSTTLATFFTDIYFNGSVENFAAFKVHLIKSFFSEREQLSQKKLDFQMIHVRFTSLQLIELLSQQFVRPWILSLLQSLLHGKAAGNEASTALKQKRQVSFDHCKKIVQFQIEMLMRLEEKDEQVIKYLENTTFDYDLYKVNTITAISLFCTAHPPFLPDLTAFLPYIKGASNTKISMEICGCVIKMVQASAVLQKSSLRLHGDEVMKDLANIALKHGAENVNSAIECMSIIVCHLSQNAAAFFQLGKTCFDPLINIARKFSETGQLDPPQVNMIRRCLVVLGFFCEHSRKCKSYILQLTGKESKVDSYEEHAAKLPLAESQPLSPYTMYGSCFSAVIFVLELKEESLHVLAMKTLCGIFAGYPQLMEYARKIDLMARLFDNLTSLPVLKSLLVGLKDMMVGEEVCRCEISLNSLLSNFIY